MASAPLWERVEGKAPPRSLNPRFEVIKRPFQGDKPLHICIGDVDLQAAMQSRDKVQDVHRIEIQRFAKIRGVAEPIGGASGSELDSGPLMASPPEKTRV